MSGTGPIQNNLPVVAPQSRGPVRESAAPEEAASLPQDSVQVQPQAPPQPSAEDGTYITVRMKVKNELLEVNPETGKSKLDDLTPDFVPESQKSPNAPVVLTALTDPNVPEGYAPVTTVALVPGEQAQDTNKLHEDFFPAFVPKGGYVMSQSELEQYTKEQTEAGRQRGLSEGIEKGKKEAVPPGFQPKLMDSAAGLKIEGRRDQISTILGMLGSTSGGLGIAAGIGMPVQYAAPLALATAPLQILGPTGTMTQMAKLENQKAALIESVRAENPDKDPMKVVVDMNPHTQMPITTEDAIKNIDTLKKTQKMKTLGAALLAGAGVAALGGWGTAATALAVGSLAAPLADTLPTFDKIGQVRDRKKELKAMLEAGQEKVEVQVPIFNDEGTPIGFKAEEVPIQEALDHVNKQQKLLALGTIGAVAQAGSLVAMGLGAPILMVVAGSVALPLLARGALFPKESWETLKALPGQIWDGIKAVGRAIGRKLGLVKDTSGPETKDAQPLTPSQRQMAETLGALAEKNPDLARGLHETLQALHRPPQNEEETKAAIAAGEEHQKQLAQLKAEYPELAEQWTAAIQGMAEEQAQAVQAAQFEHMNNEVEKVVTSEHAQSLLKSDRVQAALSEIGQDHEFGEGVVRLMAQAQIFQSNEVFQQLLEEEASSVEARQQLAVYRALETEIQSRQPAGAPSAA